MLRSGSTGAIILPVKTDNAIVIPQKATYSIQDKKFVYVVENGDTIHSRGISVLPQNNGQDYVVLSGINPGERIVVEGVGTQSVREGIKINPVDAAAKAGQQPAQQAK